MVDPRDVVRECTKAANRDEHDLFTLHYLWAHAAGHSKAGIHTYVGGSRGDGGRSAPPPWGVDEIP
jgi:hypothetical protein